MAREALPTRLDWDQQITLGRLDPMQSSRLLTQLARRYRLQLSPRLRSQIVERCDGVPLYLQEICRRVDMDRREGRHIDLDELPQGLLGLLASRIDQLDGDRDVAHVAAVLGRRFRLDFLAECSDREMPKLAAALEQMVRLEIIEPVDEAEEGREYQFTHQLLQEAAYLSCPRDVRVALHSQVVALIEERFPVWISRHPRRLRHPSAAQRAPRPRRPLLRAGGPRGAQGQRQPHRAAHGRLRPGQPAPRGGPGGA